MAETQTQEQQASAAVQSAELSEAAASPASSAQSGIDILLDIKLPITVRMGSTQLPIQKVLQLSPGSVVRLDKPVESPAELYIKDSKFATGSIVVVDGKFAVRIKEIISTEATEAAEAQPGRQGQ